MLKTSLTPSVESCHLCLYTEIHKLFGYAKVVGLAKFNKFTSDEMIDLNAMQKLELYICYYAVWIIGVFLVKVLHKNKYCKCWLTVHVNNIKIKELFLQNESVFFTFIPARSMFVFGAILRMYQVVCSFPVTFCDLSVFEFPSTSGKLIPLLREGFILTRGPWPVGGRDLDRQPYLEDVEIWVC